MKPLFAAYLGTLATLLALDLLWLGVIARPLYQHGIGHLMADKPLLPVAALFGFFAYATYDLTNLATLRQWPVGLALLDMAWGSALSAVAAVAGKALMEWAA